tara:strand:- start:847 stop:1524 length:678 start_codon:yes stop_codon:yes gene_type:complete
MKKQLLEKYIREALNEINFKSTLDERVKKYTGDVFFKQFKEFQVFLKAVEMNNYTIFTHIGSSIKELRGDNISFGPKGPKGNVANERSYAIVKTIKANFLQRCAYHFQDKDDIKYCEKYLGGRLLHAGGHTIHMWAIKYKNKNVGFETLSNLFLKRLNDPDIETDEDIDKIMQPFRLMIYQAPDLNKNSTVGSIKPVIDKVNFISFVPQEGGGSNFIPGWDEIYS